MKPFCEIIVSDILPALRAIIALELVQEYGLTQTQVAKKLGITQPAISQYNKELRGQKVKMIQNNKGVMEMVKKFAAEIAAGKARPQDMQEWFCEVCLKIRKERLICKMHEHAYPVIVSCDFCQR